MGSLKLIVLMKIKYLTAITTGILLFSLFSACSLFKRTANNGDEIKIDGLVAYYPFDNNAKDKSGNKNNGKAYGATLCSDRKGNVNSAYSFDGEDDFILAPDSKSLRIKDQITISVWFKTDFALPFAGLVGKIDPEEPRRGYLMDITDKNKVRSDLSIDHSKAIGKAIFSTNEVVDNVWHHALMTYNGTELKLFIDGNLDSKIDYNKGFEATDQPLFIGWDQNRWLSHRHFKGSIDDVRLYNRSLSDEEVLKLYHEN